jgi:zinc transport system substrate-binding protein
MAIQGRAFAAATKVSGKVRLVMRRRLAVAFAVLIGMLAIAAHPGDARADVRVVTTIKPLHSLVAAVMKGRGSPHLIVKGMASPHDYALRPSDAAALQSSDAIFWIGPGLEAFLSTTLNKVGQKARIVAVGEDSGIIQRAYREQADWHFGPRHIGVKGSKSHRHGTHHGHGHDHGGADNAHVWLDPENAKVIVKVVAKTLADIDPKNRDAYLENAAEAERALGALQSELMASLAPLRGRNFVVFHDAYQHFEERFGVEASGAISLGDGRMPGARHLQALRKLVQDRNVVCVFSEPQFEPRLVQTLVQGTSARSGVLDPLGADLTPGPDLYAALLRRNATAMAACLEAAGQ